MIRYLIRIGFPVMMKLRKAVSILIFFIIPFSGSRACDTLHLPGLKSSVEVLRDKWGVNHIYANNEHDLFFAQGYCAAKDRLFQFEIWRRQATGTVAELTGPSDLKRDMGARLFRYRGNLQKELNHYHPRGVAIITAFVNGINSYVDEVANNPQLLPIEFTMLGMLPGKWTPEVVISRHQGLLGNIEEELSIGRAVAIAGADKVKDLVWFHPKEPDLKLDASITSAMLSENILELYTEYRSRFPYRKLMLKDTSSAKKWQEAEIDLVSNNLRKEAERLPAHQDADGSNNWIVSGSRTESGYPILANDPHRSVALPSLRYMVHLVAPGWNVIGAGEPSIPGVSIGHNEFGAWGLTIFETDGEDLYVYDLNPKNLAQYKYKDRWLTMSEEQTSLSAKGISDTLVSLRYTIHGPVVFIDTALKKGYAIRCAWLEPGGAPYLAALRFDQAKNWKEFRDACRYNHIPAENMIWADKKGNSGWQVAGIAPVRKNFSGMVPVPGDGRYEWNGYLDMLKRPHQLNPKKGFLATANQNVTPKDYRYWDAIGYTWADPYRGDRINEVLQADNRQTLKKTEALQTDYYSIPAQKLVPMLAELKFSSPLYEAAKEELKKWNFVLDKSSVAAGIYAIWERELYQWSDSLLVPKELKGLVNIQLEKLITWLQAPGSRFDNIVDARNGFLAHTFKSAIDKLNKKFGASIDSWVYGQADYKHISLFHPLNHLLTPEQKKKFNLGPLPRGGNSHTPNSTGSRDNQLSGASFRLITDLSDWDKTLMINTPGESGITGNSYYGDLFSLWADDQYFPAYYSKGKIEEVTDNRMILKPLQ